ncbi:hypothetical protein [Hyalangium sp.]|uniref:hypothetical protein n=1 Tax=Hyalangium sp. TaxID=2028555 RepID=UPI002D71E568|nr:hypothetical protein [Hyalangium sp.]HYI01900.1 hypothetical protein [Hyalangium sp.]
MDVYQLAIKDKSTGVPHLHGATLGQEHRKPLLDELEGHPELVTGKGAIVVVDFAGIESVTASYIKATVLAFIRAGIHFVDPNEPSDLPPLNIFPVVTHLSSEIAEELGEVMSSSRHVCLEALQIDGGVVSKARLIGSPDLSVIDTLQSLVREGSATATQLFEKDQAKNITVNGWNNRLADLYRLRLACREKQGRQWLYIPVAKQVLHG